MYSKAGVSVGVLAVQTHITVDLLTHNKLQNETEPLSSAPSVSTVATATLIWSSSIQKNV